jgi:hypothetical protein
LIEDSSAMKSGQGTEADAPEAAVQSTEGTESTSKVKSRPEELEDMDKGIASDVNEELHLRGGAGKSSTRYKSTTTRRAPTTRTRGSSGSSQSYVSYGSGGKAMSYVSYGSGQEKKYRKPYTAQPRYQMMCCAFM